MPALRAAADLDFGELSRLISPRTGIIRNVSRISRGIQEPNPPVICQATLSHFDFRTAKALERTVAGKGETEHEATMGAIGEALERYCASQFGPNSFMRATAAGLGDQAIQPEEFVLYSARQYKDDTFRYQRPDAHQTIAWTQARELSEGRPVWVPASLVYLSYAGERGAELFTPPTSNGLAAGKDIASAVLGSLLELIERDAFLIVWMNRLPVPRVDCSAIGGVARRIQSHYAHFGIEALVFDITTDIGVPAMMAIAVDKSGSGPAAVVGLGCHLDPAVAVKKALEVCQVRPSEALKFVKEPPQQRLHEYRDIRTLEDHAGFAAIPANLSEFGFLLDHTRIARLQDLENQSTGNAGQDLSRCVALLRGAGSRVAYVELTSPDVEPFGFRVVRGIATGLQPMHFGFGEERLGGKRLFEAPVRMGYAASARSEADLNPCPHPLA
jgi:ribosomal protein S12 methylthiotransferase accessory factor